jgi:hypothetical protein
LMPRVYDGNQEKAILVHELHWHQLH